VNSAGDPVEQTRPGARIRAIGRALPPHHWAQRELASWMARAHGFDERKTQRLRHLYENTRIGRRQSCLPDFGRSWEEFEFFPQHPRLVPPPTTGQRIDRYRTEAPRLAEEACTDLFARPSAARPAEIDHLLAVSCTGFLSPGIDVHLAHALGMRPDLGRTLIGFQGCQGGLSALRVADGLCRADPRSRTLISCVELCTLHFRMETSEENLVANALFADGAAAALVEGCEAPRETGAALTAAAPADRGEPSRGELRILRTATWLQPESVNEMVWEVGDHGFRLRLSRLVPRLLETRLPEFLAHAFSLTRDDIARIPLWAVHPGGTAILDGVEKVFSLPAAALNASREVLHRHGNMSSATIWFVLREILEDPRAAGLGLALAFGPGLTIEAALFEKTDPAAAARDGA
jgi:alpha-pyrone synthase